MVVRAPRFRFLGRSLLQRVHEEMHSGQLVPGTLRPWPFPALGLRSQCHRPPQGLCRGLRLPPARSSKPHPVLCCHGSSVGLGQQHSRAGRCQKVIAKASHTHSVTQQPHTKSHVLYTYSVDLATFSWMTTGYIASFQTLHTLHTHMHYTHTQTQIHMHAHIFMNTQNTLMGKRETSRRVVTDGESPEAST